jgi:DNA polymerase/3'-5' exonuclease PolX
MSLEHPKFNRPYSYMKNLADSIKRHLDPVCDRLEIAGSVRRQANECGDIEIVCIPKFRLMKDETALFDIEKNVNLLEERLKIGTFKAVIKNGERYKQLVLNDGVYLDVFITNPGDYGRQLAIRTGPSNYSKMLAGRWKQKGWCGTEDGLRITDQCKKIGDRWVCENKNATLPPKFKTEKDFFDFIGMSLIDPRWRK